jgi:glyoxylase-like metal-dependent hydrolase (beta-lactamase superfamily II)
VAGKKVRMSLAFDRDFVPRHGEAVEITPGVRRMTAANEGPFTFRGTNTFLIGRATLAVLDPGPDDPPHIDALMREIGGATVSHILLSHSHRDHSDGVALLKDRTGAPVFAALKTPQADDETGQRLDASANLGVTPDRALRDGDQIESSDYRLEAIATPGHASDHLAFALAGTDILFSGDHVMGWQTTIVAPPDGSMRDYMASLDRLLARPERTYLPAHGGAIPNGPAHVRGLKAHRLMREAAILEALRKGDRTIPEIVARVYGGLDPALAGAAALSTLAHLEHLIARGAAESDVPPTLDARYGLSDTAPAVSVPGSG